jgi:hypothetical protein
VPPGSRGESSSGCGGALSWCVRRFRVSRSRGKNRTGPSLIGTSLNRIDARWQRRSPVASAGVIGRRVSTPERLVPRLARQLPPLGWGSERSAPGAGIPPTLPRAVMAGADGGGTRPSPTNPWTAALPGVEFVGVMAGHSSSREESPWRVPAAAGAITGSLPISAVRRVETSVGPSASTLGPPLPPIRCAGAGRRRRVAIHSKSDVTG